MLSHCFSSLGLHRGQEIHCYFWSLASFLPIYWKKLGRKLLSLSKCRWLVEQDFSITIFALTWHAWFCALLSGLFDWIMLSWVWFERSLSPTQVRCQNNNYCLWLLHVIKNGEVTSSTRNLDPHKQLWVVQVSMGQKAAKIIGRLGVMVV